jgi:hypothetical protein
MRRVCQEHHDENGKRAIGQNLSIDRPETNEISQIQTRQAGIFGVFTYMKTRVTAVPSVGGEAACGLEEGEPRPADLADCTAGGDPDDVGTDAFAGRCVGKVGASMRPARTSAATAGVAVANAVGYLR